MLLVIGRGPGFLPGCFLFYILSKAVMIHISVQLMPSRAEATDGHLTLPVIRAPVPLNRGQTLHADYIGKNSGNICFKSISLSTTQNYNSIRGS